MEHDDARSYLQGLLRSARDFGHVVAGIDSGLFDAIHRHGEAGISSTDLARELGYFEDYVRVWCQTAYALQLLDLAGEERFRVAPSYQALLAREAPGSLVPSFRRRELAVKEQFDLPELLRTGAVRLRIHHAERARVRAEHRRMGDEERSRVERIYRQLSPISERLAQGARMLEVGCGLGVLLQALAETFPQASFVGVDVDGLAIQAGREEAQARGLGGRIRLEEMAAERLPFDEEFDVVSLNIVMHELLPAIKPLAVGNLWRALRPGGLLVSNDMYYPSHLEDFRKPEHLNAVHDQAMEVVWGHRHLSREELAELFAASGFRRTEFHVVELQGALGQSVQLTTLAFK